MRTILPDDALSFEERRFTVLDLVLAGLASGEWQALERRSAAAVAAERAAPPDADEVREAARAFRYAHGLLAAADLEAWLAARRLSSREWQGYVRRTLVAGGPAAAADPTGVLRADAICSGTLRACGERLIEGAAAESLVGATEADPRDLVAAARATAATGLDEVGDAELEEHAATVASLESARERLRVAPAPDEVARCTSAHALDWLLFETAELELEQEHAAREAVLCVREDGRSLTAVAAEVRTAPVARTRRFLETPPELRNALAGARAGDVAGPVRIGDRFLVAQVLRRERPSPEDAAVAELARDELFAAAVARRSAGRVGRHAAL